MFIIDQCSPVMGEIQPEWEYAFFMWEWIPGVSSKEDGSFCFLIGA